MDKFKLIYDDLVKIKSGIATELDYILVEDVIYSDSNNFKTFSKLIYDIFLVFLDKTIDSRYTYEAYKSWFIKLEGKELFWDGRDEYLLLWDTTFGEKKTILVIETPKITFKIITDFINKTR